MKRVTGIGGIFFKSNDPKATYDWYKKHLGINANPGTGAMFQWRDADAPETERMTIWSAFPRDTKYFGTGPQSFMMNYIVDDMDAVLQALKAEGVEIDPKRENHEYGRFAWIIDPDGNRVELWEPPKEG